MDERRPLLTLRVSKDSGKTWEPEKVFTPDDDLAPLTSTTWPPCRCPIHREADDRLLAAVRAANRRSRDRV